MQYSVWHTLPSVISLGVFIWIIASSGKRSLLKANPYLALFFVGILGPNLIEFLTFTSIITPSTIVMRLYYSFLVMALSSVMLLAFSLSGIDFFQHKMKLLTRIIFTVSALLVILIMESDNIVRGIETSPYTVSGIKGVYGSLYILIDIYLLTSMILIFGNLIVGALNPRNETTRKRCKIILLSFSPLLASMMLLVCLIQLGIPVNAAFIVPVATTFLMLALINTEGRENLFKLLLRIPFTMERRSYRVIMKEIEHFLTNTSSGQKSSLKNLTASLEQHIIAMAVELTNGSQVQAASLLNTSASSICRKKKTGSD